MITRDPAAAARKQYDLIIIGGGIYGVMLALEAGRRGLAPLLLEKDDFGGNTSLNSLRILHGGLRYLQTLDLPRFRESVQERRWFIQTFPDLVRPLACLMPLYGRGAKRPSIFRLALAANDFLSRTRNEGVTAKNLLPNGQVINQDATKKIFPAVATDGLMGGAVWHDAAMPDSQRILIEALRLACRFGATALNYTQATELITAGRATTGVKAVDRETGDAFVFQAPLVINAAGPWCREVASAFDRDRPELFAPSLAWNILFNRPAPSDHALAVAPPTPNGHTYFLHPWKGLLFAGTGHVPFTGKPEDARPDDSLINGFIADLNAAIPGINLQRSDILRIFSGLLPAKAEGSSDLSVRAIITDHGADGGPTGLFSVSGVKFTTSRLVAEKTLRLAIPSLPPYSHDIAPEIKPAGQRGVYEFHSHPPEDISAWRKSILAIITEESVLHLDDLVLRRTTICDIPEQAIAIAPALCQIFGWQQERIDNELLRLRQSLSFQKQ